MTRLDSATIEMDASSRKAVIGRCQRRLAFHVDLEIFEPFETKGAAEMVVCCAFLEVGRESSNQIFAQSSVSAECFSESV